MHSNAYLFPNILKICPFKPNNKIVWPHTGTITYQKERSNLTDIEIERHWPIQKEIMLDGEENIHASETPQHVL